MSREAFICATVRTPIGRYGGALAKIRTDDLAAVPIRALAKRYPEVVEAVDEVYLGCANQAGEDNRNVARMALLLAGFPIEVPGQTVNRLCGSGMQATIAAAREIQAGGAEVVIAGGVESMTRAPWVMAKPDGGFPRGPQTAYDTSLGWRLVNPKMAELYGTLQMGETAERVAAKFEVSREEQDEFALRSHQRAVAAQGAGKFDAELVPVAVPQKKGEAVTVSADEGPRADSSLEALGRLKPVFQADGSVTAGNASPLNDGASALVLMAAGEARRRGLRALATFVAGASAGVDPSYMGIGPVPATRRALAKAGLTTRDVDLVELNEAFAAQSVACVRELGLDEEKVNVNGGAIALGHPLGSSGSRLICSLTHEMNRSGAEVGLATMCIGVGQGIASIWRRG
jgi:acetyl-CoA acyltransferase